MIPLLTSAPESLDLERRARTGLDRFRSSAIGDERLRIATDGAARIPGPCLWRVQDLERSAVIQGYRAVVSPDAVGRGFEVMLDIDLLHQDAAAIHGFEDALAREPEVRELHGLFGTPDHLVRVATADLPAYEAFLTQRVLTLPDVARAGSRFAVKRIEGAIG